MINDCLNIAASFLKVKAGPRPKHLLPAFFRVFVPAVIFLFLAQTTKAQDEINYAVHANIIYHFTKYINWPDDKKSGDFIIGVTGNSPIYEEFKKDIAAKFVGNRSV